MATPVMSTDPITGQAIWTLPGQTTTPTTGPGGTPASGTPWTPPQTQSVQQAPMVNTSVTGMSGTSTRPDLSSFLQQDLVSYQSPYMVEQGLAPKDISSMLTQEAQSYLNLFPNTGDPSQVAALVNQYAGQYSDWFNQYQNYLANNYQKIGSLDPSVAASAAQLYQQQQQQQAQQAVDATAAPATSASTASAVSGARDRGTPAGSAATSPSPFTGPPPTNPFEFGTWLGQNATALSNTGTPSGPGLSTNPSNVTNLGQLIYSPTAPAGSPAATPGIGPMLTGGMTPPYTSPPAPGLTPDQMLAYNSGDINYLRSIVQNGGLPINQTPAWQAMVDAQQQNINRNLASLKEQFGASGNRFGTAFGTAAGDFLNQAGLQQNALLAQMVAQAQENAAQRQFGGASTLGQFGQQGLSQLSSQDFQALMQQQQQQLQAALAMLQTGYGAASQINQGAIQGVGLGGQFSNGIFQNYLQNLGLGSQLGQQQFGIDQNALQAMYQEFLRTQPQYNPLMGYFAQGANTYPQLFQPQFPISQLGSILGGVGGLLGSAPGIISALYGLFGGGQNLGNYNPFGGIFGGGSTNPFIFSGLGYGGYGGFGGFGGF